MVETARELELKVELKIWSAELLHSHDKMLTDDGVLTDKQRKWFLRMNQFLVELSGNKGFRILGKLSW